MKKQPKRHNHKHQHRTAPLRQRPAQLLLRCFAEKKGEVWQAFCLDLNLATQGATVHEVRTKLHDQIADYLYDALSGEDRAYAAQLLNRPAPFSIRMRYHYLSLACRIKSAHNGICQLFTEVMPLVPVRA